MSAYYNEFDKGAAAWLRELIRRGLIAPGDVDERSIVDVRPDDLAGYRQCHFFAGIGGWSHALRLAGWPDDKPVWTGSPPCQPFSAAGKRLGKDDERHLAPVWLDLVLQCRPPILFGEQVADAIRVGWLDDLQDRLEDGGYACGSAVLTAASFGAPHIRKRLYFGAVGVGNSHDPRLERQRGGHQAARGWDGAVRPAAEAGEPCGLADTDGKGSLRDCFEDSGDIGRPRPTNGFWRDADWLLCRDGKWRPVEPGTQQMVDGISRGMGLLRADHIAKEEMNHATEAVGLADQVLRALRSGHGAQAVWGSLGGCVGLPEATLLLASLCQQSRELGWFFDRATAGGAPGGEGIVRAVRQGAPEAACASPGRGCTEQLAWELGDALPELSQACPSARQHLDQLRQFTGSPLAHGIPARVGRLRGYGNAIVPQVAAEFIGAFLDVTERAA